MFRLERRSLKTGSLGSVSVCEVCVFGCDVRRLISELLPSQLLVWVQVRTVCGGVSVLPSLLFASVHPLDVFLVV